jgi:hypothetical protein
VYLLLARRVEADELACKSNAARDWWVVAPMYSRSLRHRHEIDASHFPLKFANMETVKLQLVEFSF